MALIGEHPRAVHKQSHTSIKSCGFASCSIPENTDGLFRRNSYSDTGRYCPCYVSQAETQAQDSCGSKTPECTLRVSKISLNTQTRGAHSLVYSLPTNPGDGRKKLREKGLRQEYVLLILNGCFTKLFTLSTLSSLCLSSYKPSSISSIKWGRLPLTRCGHNSAKCVTNICFLDIS